MKNGFTLIELLAVLIILGLLIVLAVPAYTSIFTDIKRSNLQGKLTDIEAAAKKYGDKIKDDIKDAPNSCINIEIEDLITRGLITSDDEEEPIIYSPVDSTPLMGYVHVCYCSNDFDLESYYVTEFEQNKIYYVDDYVLYNNKVYKATETYKDGSGINGIIQSGKQKGKRYFVEVTC